MSKVFCDRINGHYEILYDNMDEKRLYTFRSLAGAIAFCKKNDLELYLDNS